MTVASSTNKTDPFSGNDVATAFAFTFKCDDAASLRVVLTSTLSVESTLVLDTDYTLALNTNQKASPGGSVTYPISGTPLATGEKLTIIRDLVPQTQATALPNQGAWQPEVVEQALDKVTQLVQQVSEAGGRSIKLPVSSTLTGLEIPEPEAGKTLFWNEDATALSNGATGLDIAAANSYAIAAAASAVAALASETAAGSSETAAQTAQTSAETAETNAETAQTAAELALDTFTDLYLGAKASDPTLDNDGAALQDGALYFNTTDNETKVYDLGGTAWQSVSAAITAALAAQSAAETAETNAETAETNAAASAVAAAASETAAGISETNAGTSETNAGTSETNAAASAAIATLGAGIDLTFNSLTTDVDKAAGDVWLNHATPASATVLYVDNVDNNAASITSLLDSLDDPTTSISAHIRITKASNPAVFAIYNVTGLVTDGTGYRKIAVTYVTGAGSFLDNDKIAFNYSLSGDDGAAGATGATGAAGAGSGDMLVANNLSDVAAAATAFANIKQAATSSATGVSELAIASEVNTGTDAARTITPDALAGSIHGVKKLGGTLAERATAASVATFLDIPVTSDMEGMELFDWMGNVVTAGTTGTQTLDILKNGVTMFATKPTIDSAETTTFTAAAAGVLKTDGTEDVTEGDIISFGITALHTTPALGSGLVGLFRKP